MHRGLLISLLATTFSCAGGDNATTGGPTGAADPNGPRDTLVVAFAGDIDSLNPIVASNAADSQIIDQINVPLVDTEFDCSLKKKPGVATEWSWSEDGKTLSMTIRDDLTWSDGQKVTAEDIQFTYELLADPVVATPRAGYLERLVPDARPKIIDATHIEWQFTNAYDRDSQIAHVGMGIVPKHILATADRATLKGDAFSKSPTVDGPFKIAKYEPNQRIVLEPNENYTGPAEKKPKLERVIFRVIPEYSTRLLELQNGTVDMMESVLVSDADALRKQHPEINLVRRGWRSMDYVAWNLKNPLFEDKRVRQALAKSVNIDDIIGKLLTSDTGEAYARPAIGTITPELCGVHNDDIKPFPYDLTAAKALFAEAGWTDTDGDGVLDKDGKRFEFTLTTNQENKRRGEAAIRLQAAFKAVGVVVNIDKLEFNSMTERLKKRDYEAVLGGWSAGLFVDPSDVWHSDPPGNPSEFNYTSYSNPKADELIERGLATPKPEEAAPIWKELQGVIYDDQPYLFLWWMDEIVAVNNRFTNTHVSVLSNYKDLWDWQVPADKVKYKH